MSPQRAESSDPVTTIETDLNTPYLSTDDASAKEAGNASVPSTLKTSPKPRTASASSGGAGGPSRVRAAASLWENKTSTSPVNTKPGRPGSPAKSRSTSGKVTPATPSGRVTPSSRTGATRSNSNGAARTATSPSSTKRTPLLPKLTSPNGQSPPGFAPSSFKSVNAESERRSPSTTSPRSSTPPPSLPSPIPPVPPLPVVAPSPGDKEEEMLPRFPSPTPSDSPATSPVSPATTLLPAAPISPAAETSPAVPDSEPVISLEDQVSIVEKQAQDEKHGVLNVPEPIEVEVEVESASIAQPTIIGKEVEIDFSKKTPVDADDEAPEEIELRVSLDEDLRATPASAVHVAGGNALDPTRPPKTTPPAGVASYIPLSRETSPTPPSRGVTSLFSRVLPPSPSASLFPPPMSTTILPTTPPRDSSKSALKDDNHDEPKALNEQWASAKGKGNESTSPSNKEPESSPAPSPAPISTSKSRFFSTATSAFSNLQLPSVSLPSLPTGAALQPRPSADVSPPSEPSSNLAPMPAQSAGLSTSPGSSWRTTMTHFLQRTQPSTPPPVPTTPSRNGSGSAPVLTRVDSVSDQQHHMRESDQEPLGEGFERVRNEMEVAAREIRRERAGRGISLGTDENVDWTFWGAVVQDYEEVANSRPKELSRAIQQGIPAVIRGPIWQLMSSSKNTNLEETYKALLKQTSPYEKAIQKDINRTFPSHKFFQGTIGQEGLFVVCKAYSLYDPDVGYTQGLAFIVATLLLNMPDEEAFCVLVRLMTSYNLRSHYLDDMPGLQLRLFQFDRLVEEVLPLLHTHLVRKGIKSSMYASQWLMTLFSYRFPLSLVYRVVDIVLAEGTEAVFHFALALLRKCEDALLQLEFEELLAFLTGDLYDCYRVDSADGEEQWRTNDFVRDAYEIRITPLMLDQYEAEWNEKCRIQNAHVRQLEAHARETEQLRGANRHLSSQVKTLEASLATMNQEHVELVRQLVLAKIAKEDMETELVKYKAMCAALAQGREDDFDLPHIASRGSANSLTALPPSRRESGLSSAARHSPNLSPNPSATGRVSPGPTGRAEYE